MAGNASNLASIGQSLSAIPAARQESQIHRISPAVPLTATASGRSPAHYLPRGTRSCASAPDCDPEVRFEVLPAVAHSLAASGVGVIRCVLESVLQWNRQAFLGRIQQHTSSAVAAAERAIPARRVNAIRVRTRRTPPWQALPATPPTCSSKARSVRSDAGQSQGGRRYDFRRLLPECS